MSMLAESQIAAAREAIMRLDRGSVRPETVDIVTTDGPDGPSVLVTVRLAGQADASEWDADDFLRIRRNARTIALRELGSDMDVRLVYEDASSSEGEDAPEGEGGTKRAVPPEDS